MSRKKEQQVLVEVGLKLDNFTAGMKAFNTAMRSMGTKSTNASKNMIAQFSTIGTQMATAMQPIEATMVRIDKMLENSAAAMKAVAKQSKAIADQMAKSMENAQKPLSSLMDEDIFKKELEKIARSTAVKFSQTFFRNLAKNTKNHAALFGAEIAAGIQQGMDDPYTRLAKNQISMSPRLQALANNGLKVGAGSFQQKIAILEQLPAAQELMSRFEGSVAQFSRQTEKIKTSDFLSKTESEFEKMDRSVRSIVNNSPRLEALMKGTPANGMAYQQGEKNPIIQQLGDRFSQYSDKREKYKLDSVDISSFDGDAKKVTNKTKEMTEGFKSLGYEMLAAGYGMARLGKAISSYYDDASSKYESVIGGLAKVQSLYDGSVAANTKELTGYMDDIFGIAEKYGVDVEGILERFYDLKSALPDLADPMSTLEIATRLAKAGLASSNTEIEALVSAGLAFKDMSNEFFESFSNKMKKTVDVAMIETDQMLQAVKALGPVFARAGVSADEMLAIIGTSSNVSAATISQSITQIKALATQITNLGTKQLKEMAKSIEKETGKTMNSGRDMIAHFGGFQNTILAIMEYSGETLEAIRRDPAKILTSILGSDEGIERFKEIMDQIIDGVSDGRIENALKQQMDGVGAHLTDMQRKQVLIDKNMLSIGKSTEGWNLFLKDVELSISSIVAGLGPMGVAFGGIVNTAASLFTSLGSFALSFDMLSKFIAKVPLLTSLATGLQGAFGPVALGLTATLGAIIAVVAAFATLTANMERTKADSSQNITEYIEKSAKARISEIKIDYMANTKMPTDLSDKASVAAYNEGYLKAVSSDKELLMYKNFGSLFQDAKQAIQMLSGSSIVSEFPEIIKAQQKLVAASKTTGSGRAENVKTATSAAAKLVTQIADQSAKSTTGYFGSFATGSYQKNLAFGASSPVTAIMEEMDRQTMKVKEAAAVYIAAIDSKDPKKINSAFKPFEEVFNKWGWMIKDLDNMSRGTAGKGLTEFLSIGNTPFAEILKNDDMVSLLSKEMARGGTYDSPNFDLLMKDQLSLPLVTYEVPPVATLAESGIESKSVVDLQDPLRKLFEDLVGINIKQKEDPKILGEYMEDVADTILKAKIDVKSALAAGMVKDEDLGNYEKAAKALNDIVSRTRTGLGGVPLPGASPAGLDILRGAFSEYNKKGAAFDLFTQAEAAEQLLKEAREKAFETFKAKVLEGTKGDKELRDIPEAITYAKTKLSEYIKGTAVQGIDSVLEFLHVDEIKELVGNTPYMNLPQAVYDAIKDTINPETKALIDLDRKAGKQGPHTAQQLIGALTEKPTVPGWLAKSYGDISERVDILGPGKIAAEVTAASIGAIPADVYSKIEQFLTATLRFGRNMVDTLAQAKDAKDNAIKYFKDSGKAVEDFTKEEFEYLDAAKAFTLAEGFNRKTGDTLKDTEESEKLMREFADGLIEASGGVLKLTDAQYNLVKASLKLAETFERDLIKSAENKVEQDALSKAMYGKLVSSGATDAVTKEMLLQTGGPFEAAYQATLDEHYGKSEALANLDRAQGPDRSFFAMEELLKTGYGTYKASSGAFAFIDNLGKIGGRNLNSATGTFNFMSGIESGMTAAAENGLWSILGVKANDEAIRSMYGITGDISEEDRRNANRTEGTGMALEAIPVVLGEVGNGLMSFLGFIWELISGTEAFQNIMSNVTAIMSGIIDQAIVPLWDAIAPLVQLVFALAQILVQFLIPIFNWFGGILAALMPFFVTLINAILQPLAALLNALMPILGVIFALLTPFLNIFASIVEIGMGLLVPVFNVIAWVVQLAAIMMAPFVAIIVVVTNALANMADWITSFLRNPFAAQGGTRNTDFETALNDYAKMITGEKDMGAALAGLASGPKISPDVIAVTPDGQVGLIQPGATSVAIPTVNTPTFDPGELSSGSGGASTEVQDITFNVYIDGQLVDGTKQSRFVSMDDLVEAVSYAIEASGSR
jgi:hypothetical protein